MQDGTRVVFQGDKIYLRQYTSPGVRDSWQVG